MAAELLSVVCGIEEPAAAAVAAVEVEVVAAFTTEPAVADVATPMCVTGASSSTANTRGCSPPSVAAATCAAAAAFEALALVGLSGSAARASTLLACRVMGRV